MGRLILFLSLCIAVFQHSILHAAVNCQNPIGKIISLQGVADAQTTELGQWQSIKTADPLCPGMLRTSKWSKVTLLLNNGSLISLPENSTITLSAPERSRQQVREGVSSWLISLFQGKAFVRSRQPQRLNVRTPFINAIHKGTEFLVEVSETKAEISVFDGSVSGDNQGGSVHVQQGFKAIAEAGKKPRVKAFRIRPEDAVQWQLYYPPVVDASRFGAEKELAQALAAYRRGDVYQALSALEAVPEIARNKRYLILKAGLMLTAGKVDEAEPLIRQVKTSQPDNSDALALEAVIAVSKNKQQEALALAEKAIAADPNSPTARIAQSYAHQALFDIDKALKATEEAVKLAPDNALAWARLSELQLSQGDHEAAKKSAQKAQVLNPQLARTQTVLGFAHLAETRIGEAQRTFQEALALDSSDPLARLGLGLAKIRQGEVEAGKAELESAVNLDPSNALLRSYLGKAYYELRNKDFAGKEFEIAKEIDSKDPTPYFYDAILKQTVNRPVEALHDMQKAIELNGNRGVYRSKLLLDKDEAARQVGLGRIFTNLGFDDPANRQAMKSLASDPGNYSAHRLLSDSYLIKPQHEIVRSSEYLQSQLLQPLNYNPIQPSLAYTDLNIIRGIGPNNVAFNEYNRLFERNGIRFNTTGLAGTNNTFGDETALAGIYNKFSFSLGQLHYETDGFRQNNDLKHNIYNVFTQYEFSPELNVQAEYRRRETEHGDLEIQGDPGVFRDFKRRNIDQDTYRLGLKYSPTIHSDLLVSFIHANREERVKNFADRFKDQTHNYNFETQYLFHNETFNAILGGGIYRNEVDASTFDDTINQNSFSQYDISQYTGYFYSNYKLLSNLNITAGLSFDHYHDNSSGAGQNENELNPKLGLIWKASDYITFRAAGFKTVKSAIIDNQTLQPTQIAGFNQFYDDVNGVIAWQYGAGMDINTRHNFYAGVEAFKRDLRIPIADFFQEPTQEIYRLYVNWTPHDYWAFNSEFRFENYRSDGSFPPFPKFAETFFLPAEIRFFHPSGFFAALKGTYVSQKIRQSDLFAQFGDEGFNSDFYLVDAAAGYRFPKQYGLISIEARNLFDSNFRYRDRTYQGNENRPSDFYPERMVFAKITFNY